MNKKLIVAIITLVVLLGTVAIINVSRSMNKETHVLEGTILSSDKHTLTVQDSSDSIYTFEQIDSSFDVGSKVAIEYVGLLNDNAKIKEIRLVEEKDIEKITGIGGEVNPEWLDDGIFSKYYTLTFNRLKKMSLDDRIAQLLLVRYPDTDTDAVNMMKKYQFGGYVLFAKDFRDKTKNQVLEMINNVQEVAEIPALTAVDEEGGTVVRVSSNTNLRKEKFKAPSTLYKEGGFDLIKEDTVEKSKLLSSLGLNLNLAPVVDVSEHDDDYMYSRALQQNTNLTSTFAKTVIEASKDYDVSYTLKHFPGYGNNSDTHIGTSVDNRSYESILKNDIPPFEAGIKAGAEAVLVSHNVVTNIDKSNPASLSSTIHNLLRDELDFTGVIISDDLDMGAVAEIPNVTVKALRAGNDIIITTDYKKSFDEIKEAVQKGDISEDIINRAAFRVVAWKYYKGLIYDNQK